MKLEHKPEYNRDQIKDLIENFDKNGTTFYAKRNTIKIFKVGDEEWNVKAFKVPHFINKFVYRYIRKSKAQRSYEYALYLLDKGILTPKPIGFVEYHSISGIERSFYISENLKYDFTFREVKDDENFADRVNILNQFTEFTFKLHEAGINHLDYSAGNVLIVSKENGLYDFYLIDLNRMRFEKMDYQLRIKNFDRLSLSNEMIDVISKKYASLINKDVDKVYKDLVAVRDKTNQKREDKKKYKKRIGIKSDD